MPNILEYEDFRETILHRIRVLSCVFLRNKLFQILQILPPKKIFYSPLSSTISMSLESTKSWLGLHQRLIIMESLPIICLQYNKHVHNTISIHNCWWKCLELSIHRRNTAQERGNRWPLKLKQHLLSLKVYRTDLCQNGTFTSL